MKGQIPHFFGEKEVKMVKVKSWSFFVLTLVLTIICSYSLFAQWQRVGAEPQEDTKSVVIAQSGSLVIAGMKNYGVFYSANGGPWQKTYLDEFQLNYGNVTYQTAVVNCLAQSGVVTLAGTLDGKIYWTTTPTEPSLPWNLSVLDPVVNGNPITDIVVASNGDILATVKGSGVYKSTNGGSNFNLIAGASGAGTGNFTSIALHGNYELNGKFWVATEGVDGGPGGGIYLWDGTGWADISPGYYYSFSSILVSPETGDPEKIWAGDTRGSGLLQWSQDTESWTFFSNLCDPVLSLSLAPDYNTKKEIYVGTEIGLYKISNDTAYDLYPKGLAINSITSDPSGAVWLATTSGVRKINPGQFFPQNVEGNSLALFDISFIDNSPSITTDNTIFALSKKFGLFTSRNSGSSFSHSMPPLSERSQLTNPAYDVVGFGPSPLYSGTAGSCNTDQSTVYLATKGLGVFKSTSSGSDWIPINNGLEGFSIAAFAVTPNSYTYPLFAGVYSSTSNSCNLWKYFAQEPSSLWQQVNLSPQPSQITAIAFPKSFPNPPVVYVGTDLGLFISIDGGQTFTFGTALPLPPSERAGITSIVFHPLFNNGSEKTVFVVRGGSIYKKVFEGGQWVWQLVGSSSLPQGEYFVTNISISPGYQSDNLVAVTFNNPQNSINDGVWLSSDGGNTFTNITSNLPDKFPLFLKFVQTNTGLKLFAGLRKERLWFSTGPNFNNWQPATGWETSPSCVNAVAISTIQTPTDCTTFNTPTDVFLGTCNGVLWSNDGGETFRPINQEFVNSTTGQGCTPFNVNCLHLENGIIGATIQTEAGTIWPILIAGTNGQGVYYRMANFSGSGWDWSSGIWQRATGIPQTATVWNFSKEKGLSGNTIKCATDQGLYSSVNGTNPAGVDWTPTGLSGDVRGVCHGQTMAVKSSYPHIPEAPSSGVIWGTVWGTGVKKGTEQKSFGSFTLESITWETRNGMGSGTLEEMNNWSIVQLSSDLSVLVGGDNKGIYRTPDEGLTLWYPSIGGIENTSLRVKDLLEVESNGDVLCAIEGSGGDHSGGIFISGDNGYHWACLSPGFDPEEQKVSEIVYTSGTPPVYYAGTYTKGTFEGTVTPLNPPTITSIDVTSGSSSGGTTVTITGTNFRCSCPQYYDCSTSWGSTSSQAVASFGGIDGTTTSCSETQLVVTTPSHLSGTVNVTVRNPDTRSVTSSNAFTYTGSSNSTVYVSRDAQNRIVITTEGETPTRVFRGNNPQFTNYVKTDILSGGSFTYTDSTGTNSYIYYYKVE
jgi:hypothetical protein